MNSLEHYLGILATRDMIVSVQHDEHVWAWYMYQRKQRSTGFRYAIQATRG